MEFNVSPHVYACGISKYFKFVAIYASIEGTVFGWVVIDLNPTLQ